MPSGGNLFLCDWRVLAHMGAVSCGMVRPCLINQSLPGCKCIQIHSRARPQMANCIVPCVSPSSGGCRGMPCLSLARGRDACRSGHHIWVMTCNNMTLAYDANAISAHKCRYLCTPLEGQRWPENGRQHRRQDRGLRTSLEGFGQGGTRECAKVAEVVKAKLFQKAERLIQ